jgi:ABC-type Fe3+ transport system permease subunit
MVVGAGVAGAGWVRTYFRIWIPLLMPSLILVAVMNFALAAGATSSIILLASRDTITLSLMALELASSGVNNREASSIISLFIIAFTVSGALAVRAFGLRLGVRHDRRAAQQDREGRPSDALLPPPAHGGRFGGGAAATGLGG